MPEWLGNFIKEWAVIQAAPLSFLTVCVIAITVVWVVGRFWKSLIHGERSRCCGPRCSK